MRCWRRTTTVCAAATCSSNNACDQGWPHQVLYLRAAFPDRVDVIERVIADGDRVGLLFRVTGTHTGNFFGIEPTDKRVDVLLE